VRARGRRTAAAGAAAPTVITPDCHLAATGCSPTTLHPISEHGGGCLPKPATGCSPGCNRGGPVLPGCVAHRLLAHPPAAAHPAVPAAAQRAAARLISDCHFSVQLNHFIPGFLSYSVPVFLK
jgi:hypothetical protein